MLLLTSELLHAIHHTVTGLAAAVGAVAYGLGHWALFAFLVLGVDCTLLLQLTRIHGHLIVVEFFISQSGKATQTAVAALVGVIDDSFLIVIQLDSRQITLGAWGLCLFTLLVRVTRLVPRADCAFITIMPLVDHAL